MTSLSRPSTSQTESRIKRKPPPFFDLSLAERYPPPDPHDPFAPLWVLRSRTSSAHLIQPQSIYNLSLDRRRQSAFSLQYPSPNWSDDDMRGVISDSEYGRHSLRQSRPRQRSYSMALLTNAASSAFEFPSVYPEPLVRPNERSYSNADAERLDRTRLGALHVASNTAVAQKKIRQFLKPKKLGALVHPTSHPRVHKGSISGPVLASKPPVMNAFSLTVQTSVADSQRATIASPIGPTPPRRRRPSTAPSVRVASSRSQTAPLPVPDSISQKIDNNLMRSPPASSVSHSAFIHISYPTPSDQYSQSLFDDAYISPRPAPRPPQSTRLPLAANGSSKLSKHRTPKTNKSKPLPKAPPAVQPEWALPTHDQLRRAASHLVIAESGVRVTFGSLFAEQRTIVIFIRHFWCPLCQDYMSSVRSLVRPDVLRSPDALGSDGGPAAKLVVISNGSHAMISKYKQIFRMPFEMYTDPTLAVYNTLGMARDRDGDHTACSPMSRVSPQESAGTEKQKKCCNGGYVKHGTMGGIVMVLVRAIKVGMPLWEKGGDVAQLGGEFVFGPGLTCSYAHRMQSPKGHAPIQDVVKAALEVATRTSATEKRKPLPAVDAHDKLAHPVKSTEKEESGSYDIISDETIIEARDTHEKQDAHLMKGSEPEREQKVARPPHEDRSPEEGNDVVLLEHEAEVSDVESVAATCSDLDRSDGSTMQQSTESEEYTLNGSAEEANGQDDPKPPEQVGNAQLELEI